MLPACAVLIGALARVNAHTDRYGPKLCAIDEGHNSAWLVGVLALR